MTAIGIDYGTSNSEVVFFDGEVSRHVKLDPMVQSSNRIRSSVFIYFEEDHPPPPPDMLEQKIQRLKDAIAIKIDKAKEDYFLASDPREQETLSHRIDLLRGELHDNKGLEKKARDILARELSLQDIPLHILVESGKFAFGEEGFHRFLKTPEKGRFIYSPKNFLGATLDANQKTAFAGIIARQLRYFRQCAQQQLGTDIEAAVIGRPVKFHGTRGEAGNQQAVEIMTRAATEAGFTQVSFLEEPIAAAYKIERSLTKPTTALIVDIGGGTTDICCINLSPEKYADMERQGDVLSVTGKRLGGMECDKALVLKAIAPEMGLGLETIKGLPVPPSYYSDMCAVDNIPALTRFFSDDYGLEIAQTMSITRDAHKLERLMVVQESKLSARVVNSGRMAKELLSSKDPITLPLHYIEPEFSVDIGKSDLRKAMASWLKTVTALITECVQASKAAPEVVMITGGMSLSPIVRDSLQESVLKGLPSLENDAFNSVCEGMAIQASKLHGASV